jgi:hypothetical protein
LNDPWLIRALLLWLLGAALRAHLSAGTDGSLVVLRAAMETVHGDGSTIARSMAQKRRTNTQSPKHSSKRSLQAAEDPPAVDGGGETLGLATKRRRASTKRDTAESAAESGAHPARRSVRDRKAAAR